MFILLMLLVLSRQQVTEIDCQFIQDLSTADGEQLDRPHIIMLYLKFGAVYSRIKSKWQDLAIKYGDQRKFTQVDMLTDTFCINEIFKTDQFPYFIHVNQNRQYAAIVPQSLSELDIFIEGSYIQKFKPIPQLTILNYIHSWMFHYMTLQILMGIAILGALIGLVYLRVQIYKEVITYKDN